MNITLPDRPFKLFVLLGLILTGYSALSSQTLFETYQMKLLENKIESKADFLIKLYDEQLLKMNILFAIGMIMLLFGLYAWNSYEKKQNLNKVRQSERIYSECQSCGKNFSSIRQNGTNKDGSINLGFCISCYENGEFINPSLKIQDILKDAYENGYKETKFPLFIASLKCKIESLDRWRQNEY